MDLRDACGLERGWEDEHGFEAGLMETEWNKLGWADGSGGRSAGSREAFRAGGCWQGDTRAGVGGRVLCHNEVAPRSPGIARRD